MDFLWDKITEWLKEMLIGGIVRNLSGMFDATNQKVAEISGQVGLSPQDVYKRQMGNPGSQRHHEPLRDGLELLFQPPCVPGIRQEMCIRDRDTAPMILK